MCDDHIGNIIKILGIIPVVVGFFDVHRDLYTISKVPDSISGRVNVDFFFNIVSNLVSVCCGICSYLVWEQCNV